MSSPSSFPPPSTSVPPLVFTPEGLIVPSDQDILAGAQVDLNTAFGGGVNPALETPQGQLCSSETAVISDKDAEILYLTTQMDPQFAQGRFQDAIGRYYFLDRKGAEGTVVNCQVVGIINTVIPAGTFARDTSGNTYVLLGAVTIPAGGVTDSTWQNIVTGPIACPANTLVIVTQTIPGWDTINNPTDGVVGRDVETANEFEDRRKNSVAANGHGTNESIYGHVFEQDGVLDCYVTDNRKSVTVNVGPTNFPLVPHSVYVAVIGGTDEDVAQAIWDKVDEGCDFNGNTTVIVTDPSGYSFPPPSYEIKFERPSGLAIKFRVDIVDSPLLPSNIVDQIKAAVLARFNGIDGTSRERIAATVLASRYYGAVSLVNPAVTLLSILVGAVTPDSPTVDVGIDQAPTLNVNDIAVNLV